LDDGFVGQEKEEGWRRGLGRQVAVEIVRLAIAILRFRGLLKIYTVLGGKRCQRHIPVFYQVRKDDASAAGVFVVRRCIGVPGNWAEQKRKNMSSH